MGTTLLCLLGVWLWVQPGALMSGLASFDNQVHARSSKDDRARRRRRTRRARRYRRTRRSRRSARRYRRYRRYLRRIRRSRRYTRRYRRTRRSRRSARRYRRTRRSRRFARRYRRYARRSRRARRYRRYARRSRRYSRYRRARRRYYRGRRYRRGRRWGSFRYSANRPRLGALSHLLPRHGRRRAECRYLLNRSAALGYVSAHRSMSSSLNRYLVALRRCGWLRSYDRPRVLVYDHRNHQLVGIQHRAKTSAASLIKPFVMFAVYYRARRRGIRAVAFPSRVQRQIDRMMRVSSNRDTNRLIRYLGNGSPARGMAYINRLIRRFGMRNTRVVELIPAGGRTYRNYTTAWDMNMLFHHIYRRNVLSRSYTRKVMRVMLASRDNRGRTYYLKAKYGAQAATKTGYTKCTNGVAGIFFNRGVRGLSIYNYVAILTRPLLKDANEWRWRKISSAVIKRISEITYTYYQRGYSTREITASRGKRKKHRLVASR